MIGSCRHGRPPGTILVARVTLLSLALVGASVHEPCDAAPAPHGERDFETHAYMGTREVRHVAEADSWRSGGADYDGVFDVRASRTSERFGSRLLETETRFFAVRSGGYRPDAAMREVVVRDERVDETGDVLLDESEVDRATFGYLRTDSGIVAHSPFDGIDRKSIVTTYDTPPIVDAARPGIRTNQPARSEETSISDQLGAAGDGSISERVAADGTVEGSSQDFVLHNSFEQHADGSGSESSSAPGFSNADIRIAAATAAPAGGAYTILVTSSSTGREVGPPPYPVQKSATTVPDWYPGGKALPADTYVVTVSGTADATVPDVCGAASRGRLAHRVIARRSRTRITGITEVDADETYSAGRILLCEIERRHAENYDNESGKRTSTDDTTTTLGITKLYGNDATVEARDRSDGASSKDRRTNAPSASGRLKKPVSNIRDASSEAAKRAEP